MTAGVVIATAATVVSIASGIATLTSVPRGCHDIAHTTLVILLTLSDVALWCAIAFL